MLIKRGDLFYADLNPSFGSEQGGIRPVLVVQNNIGNMHSPTVVVLPITSMKKRPLPVHAKVDDTDLLTDGSIVVSKKRRCKHGNHNRNSTEHYDRNSKTASCRLLPSQLKQ